MCGGVFMNRKIWTYFISLIFGTIVLAWVPKERIPIIFEFIRYRGLGVTQISFMLRAMHVELLFLAVLIIAVIWMICSVIGIVKELSRPRTPGLNQPREKKKEPGDSTIKYVNKSDKEKYIAQLDSYL